MHCELGGIRNLAQENQDLLGRKVNIRCRKQAGYSEVGKVHIHRDAFLFIHDNLGRVPDQEATTGRNAVVQAEVESVHRVEACTFD
mmetsp:Transcript_10910/g.16564  ORF Transcript_10910/g.16564 Transcript_10910/m.16564 type:complete len:86 (+) Transcript_10910:4414-4671(+)